jgi:fructose transport system substrate-binding protein
VLIGQYAKAALGGKPAKIVTLDLFPGHPVGAQRHNGFLKGFGLPAPTPRAMSWARTPPWSAWPTASVTAPRARPRWRTACRRTRDINVVYTINEPAAAGAYNALKKAGKEKGVIIVSVDGGCDGIKDVGAGVIAATSQQYPLKMAAMGVEAGVEYAKTGKKASGYTDTGVTLIAAKPMAGVDSKDVKTGTDLCWGKK